MKIIQALAWYFPENIGGTEVYAHALARRFRTTGHEVLIAAPDPHGAGERTYEHDGFPVYRYPTPAQPAREEVQGRQIVRGAEKFHAWLARQHADVVHFHTFSTGLGLHEIRAAKALGARVIATTHSSALGFLCQRGTMMQWGATLCDGICEPAKCAACVLQSHGMPQPLARLVAAMPSAGLLPGRFGTALGMRGYIRFNQRRQREMLELVDQFVVLTQWARDAMLANGAPPEKITLNRLGYSQTISPKPGPGVAPTRRPVKIGYLGRFEDLKGVHDLARAVAHLSNDVAIEVEFRGPVRNAGEQQTVRELMQIIGDNPRVHFAAAVSAAESPAILSSYDVLCCPAICHEGGPTVAIEAHATGTPVIGTRIGGLAEMIKDGVNGKLVSPGDWRALAAALADIAGDPAGTVDRWRVALPKARTMDDVAADYLKIYGRAACYSGAPDASR